MADLFAELADPTTSAKRLEAIEVAGMMSPNKVTRVRLRSGVARHPNCPPRLLCFYLKMAAWAGEGGEQTIYRTISQAAAENPSLPLYRMAGTVPL